MNIQTNAFINSVVDYNLVYKVNTNVNEKQGVGAPANSGNMIFVTRISKSGNRYYIRIPKNILPLVNREKRYLVILKPID